VSDISLDLNAYGFTTEVRVRLSETDAVGVVYFGSYAPYFEVGWMDYLAHLGLHTFDSPVRDLVPGAVLRHEAQFHAPARYNDTLCLHVRIAHLGQTSYTFHFVLTQHRDGGLVASGLLHMVWLDETFSPISLPARFRNAVTEFEGPRLAPSTRR
jgi:acyl-CoA thioester hydrolase